MNLLSLHTFRVAVVIANISWHSLCKIRLLLYYKCGLTVAMEPVVLIICGCLGLATSLSVCRPNSVGIRSHGIGLLLLRRIGWGSLNGLIMEAVVYYGGRTLQRQQISIRSRTL